MFLNINPAVWQPYITLIQGVVATLAAIITTTVVVITATVGIRGLNTWRRQLIGTVEFELARKVRRVVYTFRDAIDDVRFPLFLPYEYEWEEVDLNSMPPDWFSKDRNVRSWVYRWRAVDTAFAELRAVATDAEIAWNHEAKETILRLKEPMASLHAAIIEYRELSVNSGPEDQQRMQQLSNSIYRPLSDVKEPDTLDRQMQKVIDGIDALIRPHLESKL